MSTAVDLFKTPAPPQQPRADGVPLSMQDDFSPYPHQQSAVEKLVQNDGKIVLAHQMGTGKTATAIYGVEKLKEQGLAGKALIVVPAGLRENFAKDGLAKFIKNPSYQIVGTAEELKRSYVRPDKLDSTKEYTIVSYNLFQRDPVGIMQRSGADTLVFDEFHKVRNESAGVFKAAVQARGMARNFLGLTGSLVNNNPSEVASLLTISEGRRMMSPGQFKNRFTKTIGYERGFQGAKKPLKGVKRQPELVTLMDPRVDYASTETLKANSMPRKETKFVPVEMSGDQYELYRLAMNKLGPLKEAVMRRDANVIVKEIDPGLIFPMLTHARQISNSVGAGRQMSLDRAADDTPKVRKLLDDALEHLSKTPDGQVVVYSNLVRGGVDVLEAGLKKRGINPAIFIGKGTEVGGQEITSAIRDEGVTDFKSGKKRVIVLSGAGAEGLNLTNATAFYALDGHFNPERILQAEARARRLGGQVDRAPEKRVVDVRRYMSTVPQPKGFWGAFKKKNDEQTTDEWMYGVAKRKFLQNSDFYKTIAEPDKYVRRWKDPSTGKWKYEYPKKTGFAGFLRPAPPQKSW